MTQPEKCPYCGRTLAGAAEGLCRACLLAGALGDDTPWIPQIGHDGPDRIPGSVTANTASTHVGHERFVL